MKKILILFVAAILFFIAVTAETATDTEPRDYYGKHVDANGTTTVNLRRGQSYIDGEIIPCQKTTGIEPLKEV